MMTSAFILAVGLTFLPVIIVADSYHCICGLHEPREQYNHPQVLFNYADFSIRANITKIFRTRYPGAWFKLKDYQWEGKEEALRCLRDRVYEVEVKDVFKGEDFHRGCVKKIRSHGTAGCPEKCGLVNLTRYEEYLLSGKIINGDYYIDICGFNKKWSDVTIHQKNSLKGLYEENRSCETMCPFEETCDFECYYKYATCVKSANYKINRRCLWKKGYSFKGCVEKTGTLS